ncbi:hypothetical protein [Hutsoniella sourekii]|uniref:hypothetical protein n=1 Tax=Hutsoniella sourekii TaxID=87650 RepID=UPI00047FE0B2|nr:hypothetical protein [Hutsoniella sourekii]
MEKQAIKNLPICNVINLLHQKDYYLLERTTNIVEEREISDFMGNDIYESLESSEYNSYPSEYYYESEDLKYVLVKVNSDIEHVFDVSDFDSLAIKIFEIITEEV